jgi:hypothetical protein
VQGQAKVIFLVLYGLSCELSISPCFEANTILLGFVISPARSGISLITYFFLVDINFAFILHAAGVGFYCKN